MNEKNIIKENYILEGNILKVLITISFPLIINQFLISFDNIIDSYFLGIIGEKAIAAATITSTIYSMLISFGNGIITAGMIILSKNIGANEYLIVKKQKSQLFISSFLFATCISLICAIFLKKILKGSGANGELLELSLSYLYILLFSVPCIYIINVYSAIENANGSTLKPMLRALYYIILNIILNSIVIKLNYGIKGIAFVTTFSNLLLAIYCIFMMSKNDDISINEIKKFNLSFIKELLKLGLPISLSNVSAFIGFIFINIGILKFGEEILVSFGIGNRINNVFETIINGFAIGISIMIAQSIGSKNNERTKEVKSKAIVFLIGITCILAITLFFSSKYLVVYFTDNEIILAQSKNFLRISSVGLFGWLYYQFYISYFQGIGKTKFNFYLNLIRIWGVRIPIIFSLYYLGLKSEYVIWGTTVFSNFAVLPLIYCINKYYIKIEE